MIDQLSVKIVDFLMCKEKNLSSEFLADSLNLGQFFKQ